jgi:hypothetical protein
MPTGIRLICAPEFVRATVDGTFDIDESRKVLLGLATAVPSPEDIDVLIDVREAPPDLRLPNL